MVIYCYLQVIWHWQTELLGPAYNTPHWQLNPVSLDDGCFFLSLRFYFFDFFFLFLLQLGYVQALLATYTAPDRYPRHETGTVPRPLQNNGMGSYIECSSLLCCAAAGAIQIQGSGDPDWYDPVSQSRSPWQCSHPNGGVIGRIRP